MEAAGGDDDVAWELCAVPQEAQLALAPRRHVAVRGGWHVKLPCAQRMTRDQQVCAAARMREAKSRRVQERRNAELVASVNSALDNFRKAGILLNTSLRLTQPGGLGAIVVSGSSTGKQKTVPPVTMLEVAYSAINAKADLSKVFKLDSKTISRIRVVVAQSNMDCDAGFMEGLAATFSNSAPEVAGATNRVPYWSPEGPLQGAFKGRLRYLSGTFRGPLRDLSGDLLGNL